MEHQKKEIRFMIFNESYWNKGLIYSQNILPLIQLTRKRENYIIKIYCFCSLLDYFLSWNKIYRFKNELKKNGIQVWNFPTLFISSRYFALRWFVMPFFLLTVLPYMFYFVLNDIGCKTSLYYHLRSYPIAFAFSLLYVGRAKLIFDPRSDFNEENKKICLWRENSLTDKLWFCIEGFILYRAFKTVFISKALMEDILNRHNFKIDKNRHVLFFNTIDFNHFKDTYRRNKKNKKVNFLYTGSLCNWNNLMIYLTFFCEMKNFFPESKFHIVTTTKRNKLKSILQKKEYQEILKDVIFHYNISYNNLPHIYTDCSIGLQLMDKPDSRVGVKYVEYLAAGLIPIINKNVRGAVPFCNLGLGLVFDGQLSGYEKLKSDIISYVNTQKTDCLYKLSKSFFDINESYIIFEKIYN